MSAQTRIQRIMVFCFLFMSISVTLFLVFFESHFAQLEMNGAEKMDAFVIDGDNHRLTEHKITVSEMVDLALLSTNQCSQLDRNISFITMDDRNTTLRHKELPPLFISYPSSGCTYVRYLLENIFQFYSGSIYDDSRSGLKQGFKGNQQCASNVLTVKMHPGIGTQHVFETNHRMSCMRRQSRNAFGSLSPHMHIASFSADTRDAMFLIRDPYPTIFSRFLFQQTNSHTKKIKKEDWNVTLWREFALKNSISYSKSILNFYSQISAFGNRIINVFFENIVSNNWNTKITEMLRIAQFLYSDDKWRSIESNETEYQSLIQRMVCILSITTDKRLDQFHRIANHSLQSSYMERDEAYALLGNDTICQMWNNVANIINYTPYNGVQCY